jgi:hypothetical protein
MESMNAERTRPRETVADGRCFSANSCHRALGKCRVPNTEEIAQCDKSILHLARGRLLRAARAHRGGFGRAIHAMTHLKVCWNPTTREWYCTRCGRTSDHTSVQEAHVELDQYACQLTSVEAPSAAPGTATTRLIRKPYKMTLKTERSGSRFIVTNTEDGGPLIRLELFHDTVAGLKSITVGFEVLSGTTLEQARTLVDRMNERIIRVAVSPN